MTVTYRGLLHSKIAFIVAAVRSAKLLFAASDHLSRKRDDQGELIVGGFGGGIGLVAKSHDWFSNQTFPLNAKALESSNVRLAFTDVNLMLSPEVHSSALLSP